MQVQLKPWGNSQGIRFSKEFLRMAGFADDETLNAEIVNGRIVLSRASCHKSLKERASAYDGRLNLSDELIWDEPVGGEVW